MPACGCWTIFKADVTSLEAAIESLETAIGLLETAIESLNFKELQAFSTITSFAASYVTEGLPVPLEDTWADI